MGCALSTRTVRTDPFCLSSLFVLVTTRRKASLLLSSLPGIFSLHWSAQLSSDFPLQQSPSTNFLLGSANSPLLQSLPLASWPRLNPNCHQKALFSCSTLLWSQLSLARPCVSGLDRVFPYPPGHSLLLWPS